MQVYTDDQGAFGMVDAFQPEHLFMIGRQVGLILAGFPLHMEIGLPVAVVVNIFINGLRQFLPRTPGNLHVFLVPVPSKQGHEDRLVNIGMVGVVIDRVHHIAAGVPGRGFQPGNVYDGAGTPLPINVIMTMSSPRDAQVYARMAFIFCMVSPHEIRLPVATSWTMRQMDSTMKLLRNATMNR